MLSATFEARFWSYVNKNGPTIYPDLGPCWIWTGHRHTFGYGMISKGAAGDGSMGAHRASWLIHHGLIPRNKSVLHHCDNPPCVNPGHLWLGRQIDNMRDKWRKGRMAGKARGGSQPGETHPNHKLSDSAVSQIRKLSSEGMTRKALGEMFHVSATQIRNIANHKQWTHVH